MALHTLARITLGLGLLVPTLALAQPTPTDPNQNLPPPPTMGDPGQSGAPQGQYYQPPPQPVQGQPVQGQPYQGQPYQGQPYQGQPYQGQPYQGQPQPYQGQPYQVQPQPYQGQPYQGQPYQGQPYQVQPQPYQVQPQPQPVVVRRPLGYTNQVRPQFGLALHVGGTWSETELSSYHASGIGLDLLFRVAPRLTLEMSIQYQGSSSQTSGYYDDYGNYYPPEIINNGYDRTDVPVLLGARIHLGNPLWILSPYLVGAAGGTYSQLRLEGLVPETRWFFEAQGGIGADLRLGRHFSMYMDLRGFGRFRSENSQELYVQDAFGGSVRALGNSGGAVFNFGIGGYF